MEEKKSFMKAPGSAESGNKKERIDNLFTVTRKLSINICVLNDNVDEWCGV